MLEAREGEDDFMGGRRSRSRASREGDSEGDTLQHYLMQWFACAVPVPVIIFESHGAPQLDRRCHLGPGPWLVRDDE